jgi:hypothetical protein
MMEGQSSLLLVGCARIHTHYINYMLLLTHCLGLLVRHSGEGLHGRPWEINVGITSDVQTRQGQCTTATCRTCRSTL